MHETELVAQHRRNKPVGTKRRKGAATVPNLLGSDFFTAEPNMKWVTDMICIWTQEGWLYVAILDLFSRLVVGWAMGPRNDEEKVRRAFEMVLAYRSPAGEMLLHFDQGSPYTSTGYLARLA